MADDVNSLGSKCVNDDRIQKNVSSIKKGVRDFNKANAAFINEFQNDLRNQSSE